MTTAELESVLRIECDRCPWSIEEAVLEAKQARDAHATAHRDAGHRTAFTETDAPRKEAVQKPDPTRPDPTRPDPTRPDPTRPDPTKSMTETAAPVSDGKLVHQIEAEERAKMLAQTLTVRCADCLWEGTGINSEIRLVWAEHRRDEHGDELAVDQVQRSLNGEGRRRRPGAPKLPNGIQNLDANVLATRMAGGGHGIAPNGALPTAVAAAARKWTRDSASEAVRAFRKRTGVVPGYSELGSKNGLPSHPTLSTLFGKTAAAAVAEILGTSVRTRQDNGRAKSGLAESPTPSGGAPPAETAAAPAAKPQARPAPTPKPAERQQPAGTPRSLADLEPLLHEHEQQIAAKRQEIAGLQADIHAIEETVGRILDEASARIDAMRRVAA